MSRIAALEPLLDPIRAQVHPAGAGEGCVAARHLAFLAVHSLLGLAALASLPAVLLFARPAGAAEVAALAWGAAPLMLAAFLSLTGRLRAALVLSSLCLAGALGHLGLLTGGGGSPLAGALALAPLLASLARSRRGIAIAAGAALVVLLALGLSPEGDGAALLDLSAALVTLVAASLVAGALTGADRDAAQALPAPAAGEMADLVTCHDAQGAVLEAGPAASEVLGVALDELRSGGLLGLVHVADRPAFLHALAETFRERASRVLEYRVRDRDGGYGWVETCCRPGSGDRAGMVVASTRKIDERKRLEADLAAVRAEVERVVEARARFLGQMRSELPGTSASMSSREGELAYASRFIRTAGEISLHRRSGTLIVLPVRGPRALATPAFGMLRQA